MLFAPVFSNELPVGIESCLPQDGGMFRRPEGGLRSVWGWGGLMKIISWQLNWTAPLCIQAKTPIGLVPLVNQIDRLHTNVPINRPFPPPCRKWGLGGGKGKAWGVAILACQSDSPSRQAGWGLLSRNVFLRNSLCRMLTPKWRCPISVRLANHTVLENKMPRDCERP